MTRALVVDDDREFADLVGDFLEGGEFEVVTAHDAGGRRARMAEDRHDVVALDVMMADLLELASVKSGTALGEVKALDLASEARETAEGYRERADAKGLAMLVECPDGAVSVRFDSEGLGLVLANLVSNAVKYTDSGAVKVRVSRRNECGLLEVEDTGIGVLGEDIPLTYTEFFRASNAKRTRAPGSGVGLASVKGVVERFGGEMEFRSVENEGSTFAVRFPLSESPGR